MTEEKYRLLFLQLSALVEGVREPIPNLANASALIFQSVEGLNWAGFYLNTGKELLLGPFQGKPACVRIPFTRGVCGAAARTLETQRVADVHQFPGHIACDCASKSELVIPITSAGRLAAVLDLDSPLEGRFTLEDQRGMEALATLLQEACDW